MKFSNGIADVLLIGDLLDSFRTAFSLNVEYRLLFGVLSHSFRWHTTGKNTAGNIKTFENGF